MSDPPAHKRLRSAEEGGGEGEDPAVTRFREFLRIPTISGTEHTNAAYELAIKFLVRMAEEINLPYKCIEVTIITNTHSSITPKSCNSISLPLSSTLPPGCPRESGGSDDVGGVSAPAEVHHAQLTL